MIAYISATAIGLLWVLAFASIPLGAFYRGK